MIRLISAVVLEQMDRVIAVALRLLGINPDEIREDLYPYAGPAADDQTSPESCNERRVPTNPRAELALAALLLAAGVFGFAFLLLFAFDDNNQLLGLSLGLALACVHKEYPNHMSHTLNSDADAKPITSDFGKRSGISNGPTARQAIEKRLGSSAKPRPPFIPPVSARDM